MRSVRLRVRVGIYTMVHHVLYDGRHLYTILTRSISITVPSVLIGVLLTYQNMYVRCTTEA